MTNIVECPAKLKNPEQFFTLVTSMSFGKMATNKDGDQAFLEFMIESTAPLDGFEDNLDEVEDGFNGILALSIANLKQLIQYGQNNKYDTYALKIELNYLTQENDKLKAPTNNTPAPTTDTKKALSWPILNEEHFPPKPSLKRRPKALKR